MCLGCLVLNACLHVWDWGAGSRSLDMLPPAHWVIKTYQRVKWEWKRGNRKLSHIVDTFSDLLPFFFLFDHSWQQFIHQFVHFKWYFNVLLHDPAVILYYIEIQNTYFILMHWWIRQKVSKMNRRAFSMKSSRHATRKKSFTSTFKRFKCLH